MYGSMRLQLDFDEDVVYSVFVDDATLIEKLGDDYDLYIRMRKDMDKAFGKSTLGMTRNGRVCIPRNTSYGILSGNSYSQIWTAETYYLAYLCLNPYKDIDTMLAEDEVKRILELAFNEYASIYLRDYKDMTWFTQEKNIRKKVFAYLGNFMNTEDSAFKLGDYALYKIDSDVCLLDKEGRSLYLLFEGKLVRFNLQLIVPEFNYNLIRYVSLDKYKNTESMYRVVLSGDIDEPDTAVFAVDFGLMCFMSTSERFAMDEEEVYEFNNGFCILRDLELGSVLAKRRMLLK